ncbi:Tat pathway signal sequence domain protein [Streptomyces venezuelae]|uniref:SGNH/GDSL hydrolase family protein n=1 Tax=Streptomyces gardneri TaxID=66892 RepID=UPI00071FD714|nr:SGNH/GDSL hydrolase family protein [Streptomyces gardneri]ALO09064.1 Tat pathway signal sequence domain protein [Streptomyces venezuelae]WRK37580.1 SGNH/GDSL hydrolase family protein [Streptomyces venezuelae]
MTCAALTGGLVQATAPASAAPDPGRAAEGRTGTGRVAPPPPGPVAQPEENLGPGWGSSPDRAVTSVADADGLRILTTDSADAYEWRTTAVLSEPGMPADSWIGNECVIDRDHAAVVYAPRSFTNRPDLMQGGAFAAIVDLASGRVTKLPFTASLAYFDPSCNTGTRTATFSAFREDRTRLVTVDTTGAVVADTTAPGQVTSAVPVKDGVIAARGSRLVHIGRSGTVKRLADTDSVPSEIRVTANGQVAFMDHRNDTAHAKLWRGHGRPASLASGSLGDLALKQGGTGKVFLTGRPAGEPHTNGTGITYVAVPADADISSHGRLAVDPVLSTGVRKGLERITDAGKNFTTAEPAHQSPGEQPSRPEEERPLTVTATATVTGKKLTQTVRGSGSGSGKSALSPTLEPSGLAASGQDGRSAPARTFAATALGNDPVDTDRWCSVPRNDINSQALQPTPNQVEWAVDMAIRGELHSQWIPQGGWRSQIGLLTVDPQALFPAPKLNTGGRIPAQVLLGVLAQESNLWQAEPGAIPGQMGNPLAAVAGFYGHKGADSDSYWKINWENSDCGYGIGQVTDGMRMAGHEKPGETALSPVKQRAVALDYTVNIAASMYILADKWNQLHTDGQRITINNDDPAKPENWFAALWNYNLGFNPPTTPGAPWGLGWYNNPANPMYPASRGPFMENSPSDAANPQKWPYQEKVMGWAAWSMDTGRSYSTDGRQDWPGESGFSSAGFRPAWWVTIPDRTRIKPPLSAFCNTVNGCDPNNPPSCTTELCYMQFWYRGHNVTWKADCASTCGNENIKYQTLRTEPGRGTRLQYGTPTCTPVGLPSGAQIVESVPDGTETWSTCGTSQSSGSFQFTFHPDAEGEYEAKGDLHQIGGGYDGHFWYAHTRDPAHLGGTNGRMTVTGTWTLGQSLDKWIRVFAHMPDTGAHTQQARYVIKGVAGGDRERYVNTHFSKNKWVDLGVYHFTGTPRVELSNTTDDGTADEDIAWDAIAFQTLPGKPKHMVVAMGDSYSSGEGAGSYSPESNTSHGTSRWNGCRRSDNSWSRKIVLPSQSAGIGTLSDGFSSAVEFQNVACSGAMTKNVATVPSVNTPQPHGEGQFREVLQVDSGVLNSDTTLVMLTLGGNDETGFATAMQECGNLTNCSNDSTFLARNKAIVDRMIPDLKSVLETIAMKASNATVVLMGYPELLSRTVKCSGSWYYDMTEVAALAELVNYADAEQQKMVDALRTGQQKLKIQYANPVGAFVGHGGCDNPEWINKIVIGPNGDGDFHSGDPASQACTWEWLGGDCLSRESFHPNTSGTTGYAQVMSSRLGQIGYTGL